MSDEPTCPADTLSRRRLLKAGAGAVAALAGPRARASPPSGSCG